MSYQMKANSERAALWMPYYKEFAEKMMKLSESAHYNSDAGAWVFKPEHIGNVRQLVGWWVSTHREDQPADPICAPAPEATAVKTEEKPAANPQEEAKSERVKLIDPAAAKQQEKESTVAPTGDPMLDYYFSTLTHTLPEWTGKYGVTKALEEYNIRLDSWNMICVALGNKATKKVIDKLYEKVKEKYITNRTGSMHCAVRDDEVFDMLDEIIYNGDILIDEYEKEKAEKEEQERKAAERRAKMAKEKKKRASKKAEEKKATAKEEAKAEPEETKEEPKPTEAPAEEQPKEEEAIADTTVDVNELFPKVENVGMDDIKVFDQITLA